MGVVQKNESPSVIGSRNGDSPNGYSPNVNSPLGCSPNRRELGYSLSSDTQRQFSNEIFNRFIFQKKEVQIYILFIKGSQSK